MKQAFVITSIISIFIFVAISLTGFYYYVKDQNRNDWLTVGSVFITLAVLLSLMTIYIIVRYKDYIEFCLTKVTIKKPNYTVV